MKGLRIAGLLTGAAVLIAASDTRLTAIEAARPPGHHLLYLPNGRYMRIASLGNASVLADLIYLWSIQYYGNFQIEDRYKFLDHIYSGVITELDPHYFDPYWIGALILSVETNDRVRALALMDKGFRNNPGEWIFPYLAGWECARASDFERARDYFRKAAAVKGAPPQIERLVAGMYQKAGDDRTALAEWSRIAETSTDPRIRGIAENRVRILRIEIDLADLRAALGRYRAAHGAWPRRLVDLVAEGSVHTLPVTPDGEPYAYDRATGVVSAGPPRVIPR